MNDPLSLIWTLVQVTPALLVAVAVIVMGYLLKVLPQVDNRRIPIYVIGASVALYVGLCVWPAGAFVDAATFIRTALTTMILGAFVGMLAWLFHAQILKRLVDSKLSFLNQENQNNNQPKP